MERKLNPTAVTVAKILIGMGIVGYIVYATPILDLFYLFGMIVIVPMSLLFGAFLASSGLYDLLSERAPTPEDVRAAYREVQESFKRNDKDSVEA